jgi:hypothetical protein
VSSVIITLLADGFDVAPTRLPGSPGHELRPPRQDCQGTPCAYVPLDDVDPCFLPGGQPGPAPDRAVRPGGAEHPGRCHRGGDFTRRVATARSRAEPPKQEGLWVGHQEAEP